MAEINGARSRSAELSVTGAARCSRKMRVSGLLSDVADAGDRLLDAPDHLRGELGENGE